MFSLLHDTAVSGDRKAVRHLLKIRLSICLTRIGHKLWGVGIKEVFLLFLLSLFFLHTLAQPCPADPMGLQHRTSSYSGTHKSTQPHSVVQVNLGNITVDLNRPLKAMSDALRQQPLAANFRVNWFTLSPPFVYHNTALYDRRHNTLRLYNTVLWDSWWERERVFYIGVTDKTLFRVAQVRPGDESRIWSTFSDALLQCGLEAKSRKTTTNNMGVQAAAEKRAKEADHTPHVFVRSGIIQVRIHDVIDSAYEPLESLAQVIRRYPQKNHYRVTWGCFYGRHSSKATVLYNRRQHRLYYNCKGFDTPWGNFYQHSVFTGVTDRALTQDARNRKGSTKELPLDDKDDLIFDDLPKYGCLRHDFPPPPEPKSVVTLRGGTYTMTRGRMSMKKVPLP